MNLKTIIIFILLLALLFLSACGSDIFDSLFGVSDTSLGVSSLPNDHALIGKWLYDENSDYYIEFNTNGTFKTNLNGEWLPENYGSGTFAIGDSVDYPTIYMQGDIKLIHNNNYFQMSFFIDYENNSLLLEGVKVGLEGLTFIRETDSGTPVKPLQFSTTQKRHIY